MAEALVRQLELSEANSTFAKFRDEYEWDNANLAAGRGRPGTCFPRSSYFLHSLAEFTNAEILYAVHPVKEEDSG